LDGGDRRARAMIVKVQRPVTGSGPWLVYDETRQHVWNLPPSEITDKARAQMGRALKRFFEVEIEGDDILILRQVEPQNW